MTDLIQLKAASTCVGSSRNFAAVIQQIVKGKRALIDQKRVSSYQVLYIVDVSKSFFKVICWGDDLPLFDKEDHDDTDIALDIGDLVFFHACVIKSYRGNIEAHFTKQSRVQLLYRRDRYFSTGNIRLKDMYPMIEWYKKHRGEIFLDEVNDKANEITYITNFRHFREDMIVNVECTVQNLTNSMMSDRSLVQTEFSGVLLCEVVMVDLHNTKVALNLWDQHAEKRFVTQLLAHSGTIKICGLVVTSNSTTNQLHCNTTPRSTFSFNHGQRDNLTGRYISEAIVPRILSSVDALDSSPAFGHVVLDAVSIEQVLLGVFGGHSRRIEPQFTPLLVESYCTVCNQTLPTLEDTTIPHMYGPCRSHCRATHVTKERMWRYRSLKMVLRDAKGTRLHVHVASALIPQLVGNIEPELLIHPVPSPGQVLHFNVRFAVAKLLNSLVEGGSHQKFRVELARQENCHGAQSICMDDSMEISGECKQLDVLVALEPVLQPVQ